MTTPRDAGAGVSRTRNSARPHPVSYRSKTSRVARPLHRSWSRWFRESVWARRFIYRHNGQPHVQWSWRAALTCHLPVIIELPTAHAPWLNHEAVAYREAIGRAKFNGVFLG